MNAEQVSPEITEIICGVLELDPGLLQASTLLRELPGVESIKVLRIITRIEARYAVELDEQVVFNVGTLDELVQEVVKARAAATVEPEQRAAALA
jgi:acyl carrier protein